MLWFNFELIRTCDADYQLAPEDFQFILIPFRAWDAAKQHYELDYLQYHHASIPGFHDVPSKKYPCYSLTPYSRKHFSQYDGVFDRTKQAIDEGWLIGLDKSKPWHYYNNPFYFDSNGNLIYDCFMQHWHPGFEIAVTRAYERSLSLHNGRKPVPTDKKRFYQDTSIRQIQTTQTINSKEAGRLLAAGGLYNGNIADFRKTAEQLGGEALEGYDQVLNEKTAGTAIAVASILLAKHPGSTAYSEINGYFGKLRGELKLANKLTIKEINYTKRNPVDTSSLRREFDNTVRKKFLMDMASTPESMNNFSPSQLLRLRNGKTPEGWEVHHKLPLDDGGTNAFENLVLMEKEPYHKIFTNMQRAATKGMSPGDSKITPWAIPSGSVYPHN
ncbi:HNH endonuclease signature motif containing protein [Enterobacter cancerogenus]|uniref:HNH endonuclease signature motif containing protein n=1 Tax=Enterobacter cancerogenus TaxID=69218 RepID=UPI001F434472|nr:HNH endonuclease signature motif containing protein [Enterobacter cancerogenus]